jgi:hypothetical protein
MVQRQSRYCASSGFHIPLGDPCTNEYRFEAGAHIGKRRESLRVGRIAPAVGVNSNIKRLGRIGHEMRQVADVAHGQGFAHVLVFEEKRPLLRRFDVFLPGDIGAPIRKIRHELLPRLHDRVRQIAGAVLVRAAGAQRGVIGLPRRGQRRQSGTAANFQIVADVDMMRGANFGIVRFAGTERQIGITRDFADLAGRFDRAQELRNLQRQGLGCELADEAMCAHAPSERLAAVCERKATGDSHRGVSDTEHRREASWGRAAV